MLFYYSFTTQLFEFNLSLDPQKAADQDASYNTLPPPSKGEDINWLLSIASWWEKEISWFDQYCSSCLYAGGFLKTLFIM